MECRASEAWTFFRERLGSPRAVCAPMVRGSERAFRELAARHGVAAAWSPMVEADAVVALAERAAAAGEDLWQLTHCAERLRLRGLDLGADERRRRPVVVQLAGREPEAMVCAGRIVQERAIAVDVNLGCPQSCAERRGFGAFLLDEPDRAVAVVRALASGLAVPVLCKIRVLEGADGAVDRAATVAFARRLEEAGCAVLTVHGRSRSTKHNGPVDLEAIAAVVDAVAIPVLANGGVNSAADVTRVLAATRAAGVMLASGLLANPRLMTQAGPACLADALALAEEYLWCAWEYPPPEGRYLQVHLRHILRGFLSADPERRWWSALQQQWMQFTPQFLGLIALLARARGLAEPDLARLGPACPPLDSFRALKHFEGAARARGFAVGRGADRPPS